MISKSVLAGAAMLAAGVAVQPAYAVPTIGINVSELDDAYVNYTPPPANHLYLAPQTASDTDGTVTLAGSNYGAFASYSVDASGYPAIGTLGAPQVNGLNNSISTVANFTRPGLRKLRIEIDETGLPAPYSTSGYESIVTGSLAAGSTLLYKASLNGSVFVQKTFTNTGASALNILFDASTAVASPTSGEYSLSELFYVSEGAGASSTFTGRLQAVPEPVSLALLGTGLIGLAGAARRRNRA